MRFHYQNLNDSPKKYLLHGRFWLGDKFQLNGEWCIPSKSFDLSLDLNHYGDTAIGGRISLWLVSLYLSVENRFLYNFFEKLTKRKDQKYTNGRCMGISWNNRIFRIDLWNDPMESRSVDPKWWHIVIDFDRLLKGRPIHSEKVLEEREIVIPMPEKSYSATARKLLWRVDYPRWFSREGITIDIKCPEGVPFEGKGENSWDCGKDATFEMSCSARTIPEGVGKFVGSVLVDRVKNGGWRDYNWSKGNL